MPPIRYRFFNSLLGGIGAVHPHGFVILRFAHDGTCLAEYYNDTEVQRPFYTEMLGGV